MCSFHILLLVCIVARSQGVPLKFQQATRLNQHQSKTLHSMTEENRIVGGRNATLGEIPFQLALLQKYETLYFLLCGASIYTETYAITAAHCCFGHDPEEFKVMAGSLELGVSSSHEQSSLIRRMIVHEGFNMHTTANDICLLQLKTPLKFNDFVSPINLPAQGEKTAPGSKLTTSGWGLTSYSNRLPSKALQVVKVPLLKDRACKKPYEKEYNPEMMVCAGKFLHGVCYGDSGGPLFEAGSQKLIGITSWGGEGCAWSGNPAVYVKMAAFVDWVKEHAV